MSKKSQINQIFVYLLSIILVVFAGYLVLNFIFTFKNDSTARQDAIVYNSIKDDFKAVYRNFGSEESATYTVSSKVSNVCFFDSNCNISSIISSGDIADQLDTISQSGNNIALVNLREEAIISSQSIEEGFIACFCAKVEQNKFKLYFENIRNQVHITQD